MKTPPRTNNPLTKSQKQKIKTMLVGPYQEEWRNKDGIIDNTDTAIAKRLKIPLQQVEHYTNRLSKELFTPKEL